MSLRDEILALDMPLDDHGAVAAKLSEGRTKLVPTEIGNGRILDVLGIEDGNILLDAIHAAPQFRYVVPLLEQGRLSIDSETTRAALDALVPTYVSKENAEKLKSLAEVDDPITSQQVTKALEGM